MKGCLTLIIVLFALAILINFPLFIIGVVLICWGIYEYKINKNLKAKSKLIPTIITLGCILSFSGCALTLTNDTEKDNAESAKKDNETIADQNKTKQPEITPVNNTTDSPNSTLDSKQESVPTTQIEKEEEKKAVEEEPIVDTEQNQETNDSTSNLETTETTSSTNAQETVNTVSTPSPPQKEYFKNCTEMRKVYPNGVPSDHPAYAPKHDRDKDGWACER